MGTSACVPRTGGGPSQQSRTPHRETRDSRPSQLRAHHATPARGARAAGVGLGGPPVHSPAVGTGVPRDLHPGAHILARLGFSRSAWVSPKPSPHIWSPPQPVGFLLPDHRGRRTLACLQQESWWLRSARTPHPGFLPPTPPGSLAGSHLCACFGVEPRLPLPLGGPTHLHGPLKSLPWSLTGVTSNFVYNRLGHFFL